MACKAIYTVTHVRSNTPSAILTLWSTHRCPAGSAGPSRGTAAGVVPLTDSAVSTGGPAPGSAVRAARVAHRAQALVGSHTPPVVLTWWITHWFTSEQVIFILQQPEVVTTCAVKGARGVDACLLTACVQNEAFVHIITSLAVQVEGVAWPTLAIDLSWLAS